MNETELKHRLEAELAGVRFTHDLGAIRRRGDRRRRTRRAPIGALGAVLAVGVALLATRDGSDEAFAGWRDAPEPVSAATAAALGTACHRSDASGGAANVIAVDLRGGGALTVLAGERTWVSCLATRRHEHPARWVSETGWVTVTGDPALLQRRPTPRDPLIIVDAKAPEGNPASDGRSVTWVSGRVSDTVARVAVRTSLGDVQATVRDGAFAAWWPANDGDHAVVRAFDAAGRLLARADHLDCISAGHLDPRVTPPGRDARGGCR